jgi:trehalose 6-phosphate phosphatase
MPGQITHGEERLEEGLAVIARAPVAAALFCDIDGTIAPIVPRPSDAVVPERQRAALATLASRLGLLCFVTGRAVLDGARLVRLRNAFYVGTHGLELMDPSGVVKTDPGAEPYVPRVQAILAGLDAAGLESLGVVLEDKGAVLAAHYRLAVDEDAALRAIGRQIVAPARQAGLAVTTGKQVIEVRPPVEVTKGTAALALLGRESYSVAFFLGDDLTDTSGFAALRVWARGHDDREAVCVAALSGETPARVRETSDVWVDGVEGIAEVLRRLQAATASAALPRRRGLS